MRHFFYFFITSLLILLLKSPFLNCVFAKEKRLQNYSEALFDPWGADADLIKDQMQTLPQQKSWVQQGCCQLVRSFQKYISPVDGPRSSFYPTSSQYSIDAIIKYGVLKGIVLSCDRLMRENGETWVYPIVLRGEQERKLDPVR